MTEPSADFRLLMLSAMYENGGNTTHRLLDGHPELFVYPFESQVGTSLVQDYLSSMYPLKYRWPEFRLSGNPNSDYLAIIDEEGKVRARTPNVSKFRDRPMQMDDDERRQIFLRLMEGVPRSRGNIMAAFFRATFEAWKDYRRTDRSSIYVGYSPIIAVDAEKILSDLPQAHVLEVVRNPWSAYADTKKRAVPLGIQHYMAGWITVQYHSLMAQERFPDRMHILRFEDIIEDPRGILGGLLARVGAGPSETLSSPSWNGQPLDQVYPWGTIRTPTRAANEATADELSRAEKDEITTRTRPLLERFGYV